MVCQTLLALCIFAAGLRVQSLPMTTSTLLPVSLSAKITPPTTTWTGSPQNSAAATGFPASGTDNASVVPITSTAPTSMFSKDVSTKPEKEVITSHSAAWEGAHTNPSIPGLLSTSNAIHLTPTPEEHSSGSPESVPAVGSQSPPLTSPQAPASSPSYLSASMPAVPSASITPNLSTSVSIPTTAAPMSPEFPTEDHSSGHIPTSHVTDQPGTKEKTPQNSESGKVMCGSETTTPFLIMQDVEHALSSGSIAAITVTVIAVVLLVFGVAAYLKIRHSSYGRLLDDHDYGSWGNYNNPLYDDS
ncbi:prostate androgen-regulated mucin-like protein 1 [Dipodomys spectabilis]|uniref:prostate androgen-regulated mucin-like protein 1 n=1 Tax=Dipodomys spectabilis TaxID=105255 RepID=UPI001C53517C|nr:prostate androgen-regulated mucin-like protein 1 [Dipodomys spectabilis]